MAHIARVPTTLTADAFLATDQRSFGPAWRYELIEGQVVAQAPPRPNTPASPPA